MRIAAVVAVLLAAPTALAAQYGGVDRAANSITPTDYLQRIAVIAHDSMAGRDTPSRGLDLTAQWVSDQFRRFGLKPGGDNGSYIQRYPLRRVGLNPRASSVAVANGPTWGFGGDVVRLFGGNDAEIAASSMVVIQSDAALRAAALDGKAALVVVPTDANGQIGDAGRRLLLSVYRRGPVATIGVANVADSVWTRYGEGQVIAGYEFGEASEGTRQPILLLRPAATAQFLSRHGVALTGTSRAPDEPRVIEAAVTIRLAPTAAEELTAPNTVGILEGSDPQLRDEYVVFSAHMDHVGVSRNGRCNAAGADTICNGADDDASGTVGIVELAEAFAMLNPRPRRSIIFLTVSGEERGLWGSDHFGAHPPVPIGQIVANLNADMIGRNWTDTIVVIGKEHSDLGATLHRVAAAHPDLRMTPIDDLWPNERFYFRSDHYNFAKRGVPVLFFFNGTHDQYHQPTDHVDLIDEEKASRVVKLMFYLGLEVANADARPVWNPESYRSVVEGAR